jgi:hypothetical protein
MFDVFIEPDLPIERASLSRWSTLNLFVRSRGKCFSMPSFPTVTVLLSQSSLRFDRPGPPRAGGIGGNKFIPTQFGRKSVFPALG